MAFYSPLMNLCILVSGLSYFYQKHTRTFPKKAACYKEDSMPKVSTGDNFEAFMRWHAEVHCIHGYLEHVTQKIPYHKLSEKEIRVLASMLQSALLDNRTMLAELGKKVEGNHLCLTQIEKNRLQELIKDLLIEDPKALGLCQSSYVASYAKLYALILPEAREMVSLGNKHICLLSPDRLQEVITNKNIQQVFSGKITER